MVSMCELTLKDDLLQIAQRRRHARDPLAELDEVILDELLAETDLEQPRLKVPHIPPVKSDLGDVIAAEQATQMIGDELIRHGLAGSRLQETAVTPKIIWDSIGYRPALVLIGWRNNKWHVHPTFWLPAEGLVERSAPADRTNAPTTSRQTKLFYYSCAQR